MVMNKFTVWVGAASLALLSVACDNTAKGMKQDAEQNRREAAQAADDARAKADQAAADAKIAADRAADNAASAADRAGNRAEGTAGRVGDSIENATREAGDKTKDAAKSVGRSTDAAVQTMDVKSALMADKRVDASHIDVDTDGAAKTVTLKGRVPTSAQRTLAASIAREKADGYKIVNELRLGS